MSDCVYIILTSLFRGRRDTVRLSEVAGCRFVVGVTTAVIWRSDGVNIIPNSNFSVGN